MYQDLSERFVRPVGPSFEQSSSNQNGTTGPSMVLRLFIQLGVKGEDPVTSVAKWILKITVAHQYTGT